MTCSIGLALAVQGDSWESLIGRADDALYEAKASGRDRVVGGRQPGSERLLPSDRRLRARPSAFGIESRSRAVALTSDLRKVDPDREMEVFYQPIVSLQHAAAWQADGKTAPLHNRVIGYEALLRWNHPTRGLILPSEFVRLSEDNGSIDRLGAWILKRACARSHRDDDAAR